MNSLHYDQSSRLEDHLVVEHHYPKGVSVCELCQKSFCHRPSLLRHRAVSHGEIKKFPCENCSKVYRDPSILQRHIRAHHVGARSHVCDECGKTFGTSSGLKQHTHIHSSVKPFRCAVCRKAYTQFSNLCRHRRMHADCQTQVTCSKCGQSFGTASSLSKHKRFCDPNSTISSHHLSSNHQQHRTHSSDVRRSRMPSQLSTSSGSSSNNIDQPHTQSLVSGVNSALGHNIPSAMSTPPNPFLMFRGPPPFFPPGFPPYGLPMGMFPQTPAQAPNFQLLLQKPNLDLPMSTVKKEEKISPISGNRSLDFPNFSSNNGHNKTTTNQLGGNDINLTNGRSLSQHLVENNKIKNETKNSIDNNKIKFEQRSPRSSRQSQSSDDDTNQSIINLKLTASGTSGGLDIDDGRETPEDKPINVTSPSPSSERSVKTNSSSPPTEQPLDLTMTRKEPILGKRRLLSSPNSTSREQVEDLITTPETHFSSKRMAVSPTPSNQRIPEISTGPNSPAHSITPGPTPSPSPPGPPITCPRPIHPMLLEAIYRPNTTAAAAAVAFQRPFPFLGSMGGRPAGFDHLLAVQQHHHHQHHQHQRNGPFPPKPFHEALMAAGGLSVGLTVGGKIKDRYTCKYCGKVFPRSANLTRHLRTHTGEQPYKCKYCERSFSISSNLQRHVRNIHNKERPFKCHLCDRCFGQQTNLDRHLKKHEADANGLSLAIGDSPSSTEAEREDACDEIRLFMGKVTYSGGIYTPVSFGGGDHETEDTTDADNDVCNNNESINNDAPIEVTT
ncbi:transcription factor hamlet-like isoform X2 [Condylostylus longicornis]|uniref:transcription factor hamlet-like isoform X2 n=1 Tax=Condylostylus longicornis TaxID=2530218 RepID=UPI00244DC86B|nr:transcription factor hamlet-like isoform X2 [Condylostylus longicornis]